MYLWDGVEDPYLYTARAELPKNGDLIQTDLDAAPLTLILKGLILNGRSYHSVVCPAIRLEDVGYAITQKCTGGYGTYSEMGANTAACPLSA